MSAIRILAILLSALLASSFAAPAGGPTQRCSRPDDDRALRTVAENWMKFYNRGDAGRVAALYTQDATYLTQHFTTGIVQGRANIQAYVQRGIDAKYHIDKIEVLSTGCSADIAYTIARYESMNDGTKVFGVNLVVLRKAAGKWLIVAHESAVPDPKTAIQFLDSRQGSQP